MAKIIAKDKKSIEGDKDMEKTANTREKTLSRKEEPKDDVETKEEINIKTDQPRLDISKLKDMKTSELSKICREMGVDGVSGAKKQDIIFKILQHQAEKQG